MSRWERFAYGVAAIAGVVWAAHWYLNRPSHELGATFALFALALLAGVAQGFARLAP